jgi:structure-specific endonuclease subunit SLX1
MRFFARDLHDAWVARTRNLAGRQWLRADLPVLTDFGPEGAAEAALAAALASQKPPASQRKKKKTPAAENDAEETPSTAPPPSASQHRRTKADQPTWGVHALPTDYAPLKEYIAKAHGLLSDGRRHPCVLCLRGIASGQGVYAVCPATGCKAVGHLTCWSRHLLKQEKKAARSSESSELEHIVPLAGRCKACAGRVEWGLMMKELTLRTRDEKAVYAMLYPKRRGRRKDGEEEEEEERIEEGEEEEEDELEEDEGFGNDPDDDGDEGDV